ncbi:MAG: succinoglycan biosynthesis protein exoa [Alphaproteobacteria bacterium]|nr:MAG: succinoglycan biosynthesis protein exoa [Alphaproteobacteria bacterium]
MYDIIAVIPCLNEEAYLEPLVKKLASDCNDLPIHIVIADGGSTDRTPHIAKELSQAYENVSYLHNPRKIQSVAINLAVETYGQEATYLIRLDAHAEYPDNFCQTLINEQQEMKADSVVVSMNTIGKSPFQEAVAAAQNSKMGNGGASHRLKETNGKWVDHGHHALMLIKSFRGIGGYDEKFSHNEDAELDFRLTKEGLKIWLTGKVDLTYFPRATASSLFRQYRNFGSGRAKMILKHNIRPKVRQMLPAAVAPAAVLAVFSPIFAAAFIPLGAWAFLCLAYGALLGFKSHKISIAASGIAAMIMHMAWSIGFWRAFLLIKTMKR